MISALYWIRHILPVSLLVLAACADSALKNDSLVRKTYELEKSAATAANAQDGLSYGQIDVGAVPSKAQQSTHGETQGRAGAVDNQPRFDIKADNVAIKTFLMGLVRDTSINIVPHPDLNGTISLDMKQVTIEMVLRSLSEIYGYAYDYGPAGYKVYLPKLSSRLFHLNYLNVNRDGKSQLRVSSGQISDKRTQKSSEKNSQKSRETINSSSLSGSEVNTESHNKFWSDLETSLKAIVGEEDGRKVVINSNSGVVIVRAMPNELRRVEEYLQVTQAVIARQVILEAKILEIELAEGFQNGVNWGALATQGTRNATIAQTGGGTIFNGLGLSEINGNSGDVDPITGNLPSGTDTSAFGGVFSVALRLHDFNGFIEALSMQGEVHVLSSPRVSTVNNQKAVIKVGSDEFFVTGVNTDTVETATSPIQSVNVDLTPFFSGVALDVTPQIDENGVVTLHIHPSVSDVSEKVKEINVAGGGTLQVPLALSSIRESDSIVRAVSGQVVVIGGLMQNLISHEEAGVPFLKDIPLLGALFRHVKESNKKSELVILLKPIVIKRASDWRDVSGANSSNNRPGDNG